MKRDYLAIILVGAGSSYARGSDQLDTINRCVSLCFSDWKTVFDLSGKDVSVNVYDVTGQDKVWWDAQGVHGDHEKEFPIVTLPMVKTKFPVARKRRRA